MKIGVLAVAMLLLFSGVDVVMAQPNVVTLSDLIEINVEPASITADGVSTSNIMIAVFLPEIEPFISQNLSGTPMEDEKVDVWTTRGKLTDTGDMNNTGKEIRVSTGDHGVVTVLLSGDETGVANITARAIGIEDMVNVALRNKTTVYVVKNSTEVRFTKAPSGDGDNGGGDSGIPPAPPAGTPPYIDLVANPADIPADGSSTSTITASVWSEERWVLENLTINFSTSLGNIAASAVIANGTATTILTAGIAEGVATITAEANLNGDIGIITNTTAINFTTPGETPTPAVNVTLTPTPTVTVSPTPAATVSQAPSPTKKPLIPGFEAVFAIASLLAVAYLVLRRERKA